jgi:hypothetical protein
MRHLLGVVADKPDSSSIKLVEDASSIEKVEPRQNPMERTTNLKSVVERWLTIVKLSMPSNDAESFHEQETISAESFSHWPDSMRMKIWIAMDS